MYRDEIGAKKPVERRADHSTFSKNRDRLLKGDIAAMFMQAVLDQPG
jgi:hypothetical protein